MASYDGWTVVVHNLRKAQKKWEQLSRVMVREGRDSCTPGLFYAVVVQAVLLYGSDMWVMSPLIGKMMGSFQLMVIHRLTGWQPRRRAYGTWSTPHWWRR